MKKKKGFTLVELLAVIVILAVILIIAMPKISDVIKNSKESSLETTAKLIASQAEKKYTENQVLDNSSTIKCSDVAKLNENDYGPCNITFDDKGNAKVSIVGKGKFEGMAVCNANKNSATVSSDCSTDAKYFSYEEVEGGISIIGYQKGVVSNVEVTEVNKCKTYLLMKGVTEDKAITLCNGGLITIDGISGSLKDLVLYGSIPSSDYESAGLKVIYENGGGTDVVIPSQIDGKTVVAIAELAFTGHGVIPKPTAYNNDYKVSLLSYNSNNNYVVKPFFVATYAGLGITSVIIPNTVTSIGHGAFINNQIISITFPDTPVTLGCGVFSGNPIMEDGNYSFPSNVTVNCNMGS